MRPRPTQQASSDLRRESRHQVLARAIREQIRAGQLRPGDQLPSFNELRDRWGVGRDTLERMYAALEREGLIVRERRRGVFVREPRESKTAWIVGFVVHPIYQSHPYYAQLLEGARREAEFGGSQVLLLGDPGPGWEKVDGIIYQTTMRPNAGGLERLRSLPHSVLILPIAGVDSAVADDYPGMLAAVEHLLALGHRRIAFLTQEVRPGAMSARRLDAYADALKAAGIEPRPAWVRCLDEPEKTGRIWETTGYDDMRAWLRTSWRELGCTAILAHNDETAIGVIAALHDAGLRVPEDISVVGFDGTEIATFHRPKLATVRVPLRDIGACGCNLLINRLDRPRLEGERELVRRHVNLPTQFQLGDSTAPANFGGNDHVK